MRGLLRPVEVFGKEGIFAALTVPSPQRACSGTPPGLCGPPKNWRLAEAAPRGERAQVPASIDELVQQVLAAVQPGDQLLCMSNGGFGGVHQKLLDALALKAG